MINNLSIPYEIEEHEAAFTIDEIQSLALRGIKKGEIPKNLFLKEKKGTRFFLVVIQNNKKLELKTLQTQLNSGALSFSPEKLLMQVLGVAKGTVTPLGIINDKAHCVEVILDETLRKAGFLGVHPNDNTATVWISPANLEKFIALQGNSFQYLPL